jgi:hypothetical protein
MEKVQCVRDGKAFTTMMHLVDLAGDFLPFELLSRAAHKACWLGYVRHAYAAVLSLVPLQLLP